MSQFRLFLAGVFLPLGIFGVSGCDSQPEVTNQSTAVQDQSSSGDAKQAELAQSANPDADNPDHGHVAGAHGGSIIPLGRDSYHIEPVFGKNGEVSLFTLGSDETRVFEVESQTLNGFVRPETETEASPIEFAPRAEPGDAEGKCARFVAQLPEAMAGQRVTITVPKILIAGERFRFEFSSPETHSAEMMPAAVSSAEETDLYLSPGGIYTAEDIAANGNQTASTKFRGFVSAHDMNPKQGDKICPVTQTKANPECAWIVGGQKYEFCCPPCVDEFVKWAKTEPAKIKVPEDYRKE